MVVEVGKKKKEMKKLVFALAAMFAVSLVSCNFSNSASSESEPTDSVADSTVVVDSVAADSAQAE